MNQTFTYTIVLNNSPELFWAWGWCAAEQATLEQNMEDIQLQFSLAGEEAPLPGGSGGIRHPHAPLVSD
jgi:hypothetical protein